MNYGINYWRSRINKIKVCVFTDFRFANYSAPTGVFKHANFMSKGLIASPHFQVSALVPSDQISQMGSLSFLPARRMPLSWKAARELWIWTGRPFADKWLGDVDWVYCPKNDWIPVKKAKYAVTIHGAHELDPDFPRTKRLKEVVVCLRAKVQYIKMCKRADIIFTVSQWLRNFIINQFKVDSKKVIVVGNGVNGCFYQQANDKAGLGFGTKDSYLLCVGGLNYIDGGDRIIALADEIKKSKKQVRIKLVGCQHDPRLKSLALRTRVIDLLGYLTSEHLAKLMAGAQALYYPTRYETFGIAAAEAMAAGCPVVTSGCSAVPEIVGDCGIYVDSDCASAALEAITLLSGDEKGRQALILKAKERAKEFTWEGCVRRLTEALLNN